jgi:hypothetical protein
LVTKVVVIAFSRTASTFRCNRRRS